MHDRVHAHEEARTLSYTFLSQKDIPGISAMTPRP